MHHRLLILKNLGVGIVGLVLVFSAACGGGNDGSAPTSSSNSESITTRVLSNAPTNTPTPYATPTPLPAEDQIREGAQTFVTVHCEACHKLEGMPGDIRDQIRSGFGVAGPQLDGVATAAETRVSGLSAEEYLRQSILEPQAYVLEGFDVDMPMTRPQMTTQDFEALIVFLLSLK
ncbi:cytochrome c [SAR202 cluster bacterium AD-804-J14_MRT_500m]|nr:cytochrome c [SAR202 cluster bacterium AD-804-J14_MRT_500m]